MSVSEIDRFRFVLNGMELPAAAERRINEMYRMKAPRYRTGSGYWFVWHLGPEYWPQVGDNILEVELVERDKALLPQPFLRDVELQIQYLRGKNFHRGFVDPELGPYEHVVD